MARKVKTLDDFDLTTRLGRFRARQAGFDVPKRENTGFGKAYWSKDANHDTIVNGLTAREFVVYDMPQPGDILVYGRVWVGNIPTDRFLWMPMEIKTKEGRRTPQQAARKNAPIPVVRSIDDALALFGRAA